MENEKSIFEVLNSINVNEHIEEKNGLKYLSWAWAWAEVKKKYPNAQYKIYENNEGWCYFTDGRTAWVKTGVVINDLEHIEYLPIMDFKNKSIPLDQITSFNVNTAIQRSLTKAVARHGLGLYVYAGEDLPEDVNCETPKAKAPTYDADQVDILMGYGYTLDQVAKRLKKSEKELTKEDLDVVIEKIRAVKGVNNG